MRRVMLALVLMAGCNARDCWDGGDTPSGPSGGTSVSQQVTVTVGSPSATPSPSPTAQAPGLDCPTTPISYVRWGVRGACAVEATTRGCAEIRLARGEQLTLDASPIDARTDQPALCHGTLGLRLDGQLVDPQRPATTGTCAVHWGGPADFLPRVEGLASGECALRAEVNGGLGDLKVVVR